MKNLQLAGLISLLFAVSHQVNAREIGEVSLKAIDNVSAIISSSAPKYGVDNNSLVIRMADGLLMVDTHLALFSEDVKSTAEAHFDHTITRVVNTHWHPDHSGGNEVFRPDAVIIAHENMVATVSEVQKAEGLTGPNTRFEFGAYSHEALPSVSYKDDKSLGYTSDGRPIKLIHFPNAHTDGDSVLVVGDGQLFAVGDIIWPGGFPFVDQQNGGTAKGILDSINAMLKLAKPGAIFIAGHSNLMTRDEVSLYAQMVSATSRIVTDALDRGLTPDDIEKSGLLADYESWATNVVPVATWISMIQNSRLN